MRILVALALCSSAASAADSGTWHKKSAPSKNCEWVAAAPEQRCGYSRGDAGVKGEDNTFSSEACADACKEPTADSAAWAKKGSPSKGCAWVAEFPLGRCGFSRGNGGVRGEDGTTASYSCPETCVTPTSCERTDHGEANYYCSSSLNGKIMPKPATAELCYDACVLQYGCDVVAGIDYGETGCFCQDDCSCVGTWMENKLHLITKAAALPAECPEAPTCATPAATTDRGEGDFYCSSDLNGAIEPVPETAELCWEACEAEYGCDVVGIDFGATGCFCQDACDCVGVWTKNKLHLITRDEVVPDMPDTCEA